MKYGSVCSGIEAASVAWKPLGWRCAFVSEIEPFPCRVLAHHYPDVPNLGDMTRYMEWPDDAIELLVGGTPCQAFSTAGLRAGMDDHRGNMALVFLGLVGKARPRWVVWENVPGVLSINGGRDFGSFIEGLGQLGYGWAYRVLDAQYFGVAQARRRVFVVGCAGGWQRAAAVLIERPSLYGYTNAGQEVRGGIAVKGDEGANASIGFHGNARASEMRWLYELSSTITCSQRSSVLTACGELRNLTPRECERLQGFPTRIDRVIMEPCYDRDGTRLVRVALRCLSVQSDALPAAERGSGADAWCADATFWNDRASLDAAVAVHVRSSHEPKALRVLSRGRLHWSVSGVDAEATFPLPTRPVAIARAVAALLPALEASARVGRVASQLSISGSTHHAIGEPLVVTFGPESEVAASDVPARLDAAMKSITAESGRDSQPFGLSARTLLSCVCLATSGFTARPTSTAHSSAVVLDVESDYTLIPGAKDSPRYKALGNSMAVPVMRWIGGRIAAVEKIAACSPTALG